MMKKLLQDENIVTIIKIGTFYYFQNFSFQIQQNGRLFIENGNTIKFLQGQNPAVSNFKIIETNHNRLKNNKK